jgi:hypothetical protein
MLVRTAENSDKNSQHLAVLSAAGTVGGQDSCGKTRCEWLITPAENSKNSQPCARCVVWLGLCAL